MQMPRCVMPWAMRYCPMRQDWLWADGQDAESDSIICSILTSATNSRWHIYHRSDHLIYILWVG